MLTTRWLVALLTVLAVAPAAAAQQPPVPVVPYHGVEIFCHLLHHLRFRPVTDIGDLQKLDPDETLIVFFGELGAELGSVARVRRVSRDPNRAAWLIASDRPTPSARVFNAHLWPWELGIPDSEVTQDPARAYRNKPRCPLLKEGLDSGHPVFRGITQGIATNGPSLLQSRGSDLFLLAAFDPGSAARNRSNLNLETIGYIFGTPAQSPQRVLILAGQGVFINGMLAQADNDNVLFTLSALRWLKDGKRTHALVVSNGELVTRFDLPLTGTPPIPFPPVAVLNQMLRELEDEGIPRRLLEEAVGPTNLLRIALVVGTIGILFYGAQRLWGTRHRQENVPLLVGHVAPPPAPRPLVEQRQRELLLQDNLWEPAQALARQWFVEHAGAHPPLWDQAVDAAPPSCRVPVGFIARRTLLRQVGQLWNYATRDPSRRVSVQEFTRLVALHEALTQAVHEGRLEFTPPQS